MGITSHTKNYFYMSNTVDNVLKCVLIAFIL